MLSYNLLLPRYRLFCDNIGQVGSFSLNCIRIYDTQVVGTLGTKPPLPFKFFSCFHVLVSLTCSLN